MTAQKFAPSTSESYSQEQSWLSRSRKNQPQWNALGAASLIFISGGMSIAWGAGFATHSMHSQQFTTHMQICWYGAALVGTLIGALLTHRTPQRPVYILCSSLVLTCGILYLALPEHAEAIIVARYLDGFANGLVFVPSLCSAGELSVHSMRGLLSASVEQLSCNTGILLQLLYTALWRNQWNECIVADQVHGVLSLVYGITALGLACTLCVESPVYLLLRSSEQNAMQALRYLQRPYMVTSETFLQLDEHKRYVAANRELSLPQALRHGLIALIKLCAHRMLNALSLSMVMWSALYETAIEVTQNFHTWPYVIFGGLRWCGSFCVIFLMDSTGRKKPTLFGALTCGAFAITFALLFDCEDFGSPHMISALAMLFSFQFFAGLAHTTSSVYITEAFPLSVKPFFVALVYAVELITRMIFCSYWPTLKGIAVYFYVMGGLSMVFFLLGIFCLPETKLITLTEAQEKFRKWFNKDF